MGNRDPISGHEPRPDRREPLRERFPRPKDVRSAALHPGTAPPRLGSICAMPRIVPSQIVNFIDDKFSFARSRQQYNVDPQYRDRVIALIRLVEELPDELLIMDREAYNRFVLSVSTIKSTLDHDDWMISRGPRAELYDRGLGVAICDLRACLEPLPDEQIPAATVGLLFIKDPQLRESIRGDIAFATQAFSGGEWKAATVLAGAAAEALLLWAITQRKSRSEVENARVALFPKESKDPNKWDLDKYIKVARETALIEHETATQATLAKDFRNLIHPGRSARLAKVCDRGTALSALAAVALIVRDLS
jgi:hypothetical protein